MRRRPCRTGAGRSCTDAAAQSPSHPTIPSKGFQEPAPAKGGAPPLAGIQGAAPLGGVSGAKRLTLLRSSARLTRPVSRQPASLSGKLPSIPPDSSTACIDRQGRTERAKPRQSAQHPAGHRIQLRRQRRVAHMRRGDHRVVQRPVAAAAAQRARAGRSPAPPTAPAPAPGRHYPAGPSPPPRPSRGHGPGASSRNPSPWRRSRSKAPPRGRAWPPACWSCR